MGENSGPAPAPENRINSIPTVTVTAEQARMFFDFLPKSVFSSSIALSGDNLQCAICMDDFKANDQAKKLPCSHHFHEECILRWLRLVRDSIVLGKQKNSSFFSMARVRPVG